MMDPIHHNDIIDRAGDCAERAYERAEFERGAFKDLCAEFARKAVALANERGFFATPYVYDRAAKKGVTLRCKPDEATALRLAGMLFETIEGEFDLPDPEQAATGAREAYHTGGY